jgi:RHS repeat-associated protein
MNEPNVVASPRRQRRGKTAVAAAILAAAAMGGAARPASGQVVVEYYHLDALGSIRAVTDQSVQIVERHDYYPFGEECTTGPCANNPGAGAGQPRKFTGKERDPETGLDYFGARYYGSKIGRFTTVDPYLDQQAALVDPQQWNRYAYGRNNPLKFVDPDGRHPIIIVLLAATFLLNNPTNANVTQGPTHDTIVPNSVIVTAGYGLAAGGARMAGKEVLEEVTGIPVGGLPSSPTEAYNRLKHYGRTPSKADRKALGAGADEVVDHDPPLVKRYYDGDPSCCEKPGMQMSPAERRASATDRSRMKPQPKTESNRQGAEMSRYSKEKKKGLNE